MANQKPAKLDLCRVRGDTFAFTVTITDSDNAAIDLTGYTDFILTVDPSEEPADASANLFANTGTVTDAAAGQVTFTLSTTDANQTPGEYFHDMQFTDPSGGIRTFAKGSYEVLQDIGK